MDQKPSAYVPVTLPRARHYFQMWIFSHWARPFNWYFASFFWLFFLFCCSSFHVNLFVLKKTLFSVTSLFSNKEQRGEKSAMILLWKTRISELLEILKILSFSFQRLACSFKFLDGARIFHVQGRSIRKSWQPILDLKKRLVERKSFNSCIRACQVPLLFLNFGKSWLEDPAFPSFASE